MVPVYYCPYEVGVMVLLCVVGRQLEAASISDFVTIDYVCGLKALILGGSYPSAASTHRGQVVLFFVCFCCCFVVVVFCFVLFCFVFFLGGGGVWRG